MSNGIRVDFSWTCRGCPHVVEEDWTKGKAGYRCFAPGPCQGYVVGIGRFKPYIPAWCPEMKKEREGIEKAAEIFVGSVDGMEGAAEMPENPAGTEAGPGACTEEGVGA